VLEGVSALEECASATPVGVEGPVEHSNLVLELPHVLETEFAKTLCVCAIPDFAATIVLALPVHLRV